MPPRTRVTAVQEVARRHDEVRHQQHQAGQPVGLALLDEDGYGDDGHEDGGSLEQVEVKGQGLVRHPAQQHQGWHLNTHSTTHASGNAQSPGCPTDGWDEPPCTNVAAPACLRQGRPHATDTAHQPQVQPPPPPLHIPRKSGRSNPQHPAPARQLGGPHLLSMVAAVVVVVGECTDHKDGDLSGGPYSDTDGDLHAILHGENDGTCMLSSISHNGKNDGADENVGHVP